jgi:hypothetical protein
VVDFIDENVFDAGQRQPGENQGCAKRTPVLPVFAHKVIHRLWMLAGAPKNQALTDQSWGDASALHPK